MSGGAHDLFVICKNCGNEVSPYITECPYCGNRLRKRAPKLDKHGRVSERKRRRPPSPRLPPLRRGEIPGIRPDSRPYATIALLVAGFAGCLLFRAAFYAGSTHAIELWFVGSTHLWWRLLVAPFTYANTGYAFVSLSAIGLFGWLMERRHGPLAPLALFAAGGIGGQATSIYLRPHVEFLGASGAGLALLIAWAIPDLLAARRGEDVDGDLIGVAVFGGVLALVPLAAPEASWISNGVGALAGIVIGYPLARLRPV